MTRFRTIMTRAGIGAFIFFTVKGLAWLVVGGVALHAATT